MKERMGKQRLRSGEKDYKSCRFPKFIGKCSSSGPLVRFKY
ncbi:MAG: hypothetical protein Q8N99_02585 [Nanoarchaeota archaeon]|nr:hypothetical protein [Nanoarchaeota archaeon]